MAYRPEATHDNRSAKPPEVSKPPATATVTALAECTQFSAASAADKLITHDRFPETTVVEGVGFVGSADALSNFSDNIFNALGWWTRKQSHNLKTLQVASSQEMQRRSQELGERCNLWKN